MRILAISNLYPPYFKGGYELVCKEVVEELRKRGHDIWVLTSTYGIKKPAIENNIYRFLSWQASPWQGWNSRISFLVGEINQVRLLERLVEEKKPQIVFIWGGVGLSKLLLLKAEDIGLPTIYSFGGAWITKNWYNDSWFRFWEGKASKRGEAVFKNFLKIYLVVFHRARGIFVKNRKFAIEYAFFNSHYTKNLYLKAGFSPKHWEVIYRGVSEDFFRVGRKKKENGVIKLLYCGRLDPKKGVHTIIKAMAKLIKELNIKNITLEIVGEDNPEYEEGLKRYAERGEIVKYINFRGQVPKSSMPDIYVQHDVLIFPSILQEESFSNVVIEAMACGLTVVGTTTGGSKEILEDDLNALSFPPEDHEALAHQIRRLVEDESLRSRLAEAGQRLVREKFTFEQMMDRVEDFLKKVCQFEYGEKL